MCGENIMQQGDSSKNSTLGSRGFFLFSWRSRCEWAAKPRSWRAKKTRSVWKCGQTRSFMFLILIINTPALTSLKTFDIIHKGFPSPCKSAAKNDYDLLEKGRYQYAVHKQSFWKLQSLTTKKFSQNIFSQQSKACKKTLHGKFHVWNQSNIKLQLVQWKIWAFSISESCYEVADSTPWFELMSHFLTQCKGKVVPSLDINHAQSRHISGASILS